MATLASQLGRLIPEGNLKHTIRLYAFRLLFTTAGNRRVTLGPPEDKITATVKRLPFARESLGEREMAGYLEQYQPKAGDIIVNAGAYHGYFAIYLANKVGPKGQVICFEPEPNNLKLLHKNLALNKCQNVTVVPKGLWSSNGSLPLISMGSGSTVNPNTNWALQTTDVCKLDTELERLGINRINLITMDIEGAEIEAVKGCTTTIKQNPELNFAIASYHRVDGQQTYHQIEHFLRSQGLDVITDFPRHLTTYAKRTARPH